MAENATPTRDLIVSSNELIHAKYHFSLWQKRVFMYFVSQIGKEDSEFRMQKVYIADLVRFFESDQNGTVTDIIENVPRQLYETSIQVPSRDLDGNERFGEVRLITKYTKPQDKKPGNAYIELKFNEDLKPHLIDLKKQFSKYELRYIVHLQSSHAIRIYEILKSHQYQKTIDLDVDYLKIILEVADKYKLYGDFKRKIIDKAQTDLAQYCDIAFSYKEIKAGKKVVTLRFTILENRPGERGKNAPSPTPPGAKNAPQPTPDAQADAERDLVFMEVQAVAVGEWGVSPTRLLDLIRAHEPEAVRQAFRVTKRRAAAGNLTSPAGFFVEAVQQGFTDEVEAKRAARQRGPVPEQAERDAKLANLQAQLDAQLDAMRGEINIVIRRLVEADGAVRARAMAVVAETPNPILKKEIDRLGGEPTAQDFRDNPKLREAVVWEIVGQNAPHFAEVRKQFGPLVAPLVKVLGKKPTRFEALRFLGLD